MTNEQSTNRGASQRGKILSDGLPRRDVLILGAGTLAASQIPGVAAGSEHDEDNDQENDLDEDDTDDEDDEEMPADEPVATFSAGGMTGDQHEDPIESAGAGAAAFSLSAEETEVHYALLVTDLEDVTQAHIHEGEEGEAGDVVVWLFGRRDDDGAFTDVLEDPVTENGVLATGTITEEELVGPYEGESLEALVDGMAEESTYVNVHTVEHPGGEIRGQLHEVEEAEVEFDEHVDVDGGDLPDVTTETDLIVSEDGEVVYDHSEAEPSEDETQEEEDEEADENGDADETVAVGPDGEFTFEPDDLTLEAGETVEFVWEGNGHNIAVTDQPDDGDWEGVEDIQDEGYTAVHTFDVEGTYEYICEPHVAVGMEGTITVGDGEEAGGNDT